MKSFIKRFLQRILGFERYLYFFSIYIIRTLRWNKKEGDFLHFLSLIYTKGVILDIGANIGAMSVHLARSHPDSMVYAFEPVPFNIRTLKKVISRFHLKNVKVMEFALGQDQGNAEIILPRIKKVRMHGLGHVVHESIPELNEGEKFVVAVKRIDGMEEFRVQGCKVAGIKIDVENFEYFVLSGAREILARDHPPVYAELWENENRVKCFMLMKELGYDIKVLDRKNLVTFDPLMHHYQNFFFIPA